MAPQQSRARRQGVSKTATRKPRPPPKQTSDSWELLQRQRSASRDSDIENEDPAGDDELLAIEPATTMQNPIETLNELADRLGREVESFAESLDKFFDELQADNADDVYDMVHDLVLELKDIATSRAQELEEKYEQEHRDELRREWAQQAKLSTSSARSVLGTSFQSRSISLARAQELRSYLEEIDTWELFRIVLEQHYRPADQSIEAEKQEKLKKLEPVNRYTSEQAVYDRFLLEDDLGQERALIKTWLEQVARRQFSRIPDIMIELQEKGKVGSGLWNLGWSKTREKIKGEKRARTWPAPDSSPLPQLRSIDTNELLVTSLDPDASSRQGRSLERQDAFYERAVSTICWEFLRRGTSWHEINDWCEAHGLASRAALIGCALSSSDAPSHAAYRQACYLASLEECSNEYERAIYGLISGNVAAMQPVCRSVDDHLFAHYSANLVHQFDKYLLQHHPERAAPSLASAEDAVTDQDAAQRDIFTLVAKMRTRPETRSQSYSPLKIIQSYLLANETESLIHTSGVAIAGSDILSSQSSAIAQPRQQDTGVASPEAAISLDPIGLRIVTHMCIILQVLRKDELVVEEQEMEDNLIVTYVHELSAAGKRDITPLYASRLQKPCYTATMAEVLPNISDAKEKQDVITLMLQKDMDVSSILQRQLINSLGDVIEGSQPKQFSILGTTTDSRWPGRHIELASFPDTATPAEEALIRSLEWYLLLPGEWTATFDAFAFALSQVLVSGHFACARLIGETHRNANIFATKSYQVLGRIVDVFAEDGVQDEEDASLIQSMRKHAKTYLDLIHLVDVFEAFHTWRTREEPYVATGRSSNNVPTDIKGAFNAVQDAMEPILNVEGFLLQSKDKDEAKTFAIIRRMYVIEAIIAYSVVLHAAGCMISRDALLTSMDLATVVATETTGLTETFVEAQRMKELVHGFALASRRILVLKNIGKAWKPKYDRRQGRDAGIWDISSPAADRTAIAAMKS